MPKLSQLGDRLSHFGLDFVGLKKWIISWVMAVVPEDEAVKFSHHSFDRFNLAAETQFIDFEVMEIKN